MKYRSTYGDFDRDIFCPQKMEEKYSGAFPKLKGRSTRSLQKVLIRLKLKLSIEGFLLWKYKSHQICTFLKTAPDFFAKGRYS